MREDMLSLLALLVGCVWAAYAGGEEMKPGDDRLSQLEVRQTNALEKPENGFRILFIGDSITCHGFNDDTIKRLGWDHLAGMAATTIDKDFVHLLANWIQATLPDRVVDFRYGKGGSTELVLKHIAEFAEQKIDLVVIQLGEHEKKEAGEETLRSNYDAILSNIQSWPVKPMILSTGVWNPWKKGEITAYTDWAMTIETTMKASCQQHGVPFVSVMAYALDPLCSGWGTSGGVKWHPNDAGMRGYAHELYKAFLAATGKTAPEGLNTSVFDN